MKQSSLKKNFLYNLLYQVLILLVPLLTSPYLTRTLGARGLGAYTLSQTFAQYYTLFILLGVNNYGNREIAKCRDDRETVRRVFGEIYTLQLALLILVSGFYCFSVICWIRENKILYWLQMMYVFSAGLDINWCCFGLEKFRLAVVRNTIIKITSAVLIFTCVRDAGDLWIYAAISAGAMLISQLVLWPFVIREIGFSWPDWQGVKRHIKPNLRLFLPVVAVSLYTVMDKTMIGLMVSSEEVAYYSFAQRFIDVPQTVIIAIGTVSLPHVSNMIATGREKGSHALLEKTLKYISLFTIGAACILSSVSKQLIPWYYGHAFERCALFAIWLSPCIVFLGWNGTIRNQFILPNGHDSIYLLTVSCAAVSNLVLNAILIPRFQGLGAVMATLVSQGSICAIQFVFIRGNIEIKTFFQKILLFMLCGVITSVALNAVPFTDWLICNVLFKATFGALLYSAMTFGCLYLTKRTPFDQEK